MHRKMSSIFFKKNRILRFAQKGLQCFMQNDEKRGSVSGKKWNKSDFRRDLAINSQKYFLKLGPFPEVILKIRTKFDTTLFQMLYYYYRR